MYTNPNPNLTPQCRARKYGLTGRTARWTDAGQSWITLAHLSMLCSGELIIGVGNQLHIIGKVIPIDIEFP